jgi:hypothetical protein
MLHVAIIELLKSLAFPFYDSGHQLVIAPIPILRTWHIQLL